MKQPKPPQRNRDALLAQVAIAAIVAGLAFANIYLTVRELM